MAVHGAGEGGVKAAFGAAADGVEVVHGAAAGGATEEPAGSKLVGRKRSTAGLVNSSKKSKSVCADGEEVSPNGKGDSSNST